jgi:hypothetical protein
MRTIFISYRRDDSAADMTDRVYEHLARRWPGRVFMDIDTLKAGDLFANKIEENLQNCVVMLVMIGQHWVSLTDEQGARRIDNPGDYPRMEVAAALKRGIRVIPVLVGNTPLPKRTELPSEIAGLVDRQVLRLSREDFDADVKRLMSSAARDLPRITWTETPWKTLAVAVVFLLFGSLTYIKFGRSLLSRKSSTETRSSSAKGLNISGKWGTPLIRNIYSPTEQSTIVFEFIQAGDSVVGSVTEMADDAKTLSTKVIEDGKIRDNVLSLYTKGETTGDSGNTIPYKETYTGVLQKAGREIAFQRFNDIPSGGEVERFIATPK